MDDFTLIDYALYSQLGTAMNTHYSATLLC